MPATNSFDYKLILYEACGQYQQVNYCVCQWVIPPSIYFAAKVSTTHIEMGRTRTGRLTRQCPGLEYDKTVLPWVAYSFNTTLNICDQSIIYLLAGLINEYIELEFNKSHHKTYFIMYCRHGSWCPKDTSTPPVQSLGHGPSYSGSYSIDRSCDAWSSDVDAPWPMRIQQLRS